MNTGVNNIPNYTTLLRQVKGRVALAQQRAIYAANEELLRMYWDLGQMVHTLIHNVAQSMIISHKIYRQLTTKVLLMLALIMAARVEGVKAVEVGDSIVDENFVIASLVVADPGDVLYSTVGHVGIRMQCPDHHLDYVFSYESEDVRHKILSFLAGNLKMGMFAIPFEEYLDIYRPDKRGVKEYRLNLPIEVKRNLWRVLDNHIMEGIYLPYDYIKRGCAHSTLTMLKEGLDTIPIQYGAWPETFSHLTRRELTELQEKNFPWTWFFLNLICNGEIDDECSNEDKAIMPADLLYVLQHATVQGQKLLSDEAKVLLPSNHHPKAHWCSPLLVATIILILTMICLFVKSSIMEYALLAIQTVIGFVTVYLIFFSDLVCTEWSWLIIPFNPLPLFLWKWRRRWCLAYAIIIGIWALAIWLWPHTLTDSTYIVLAISLMVSYINIFRTLKPNTI